MSREKFKRGFTFIETLVAVTIVVLGVIAPLAVASKVLFSMKKSEDYLVASYLAQEGLEIVRQKKDSALIDALRDPAKDRYKFLRVFNMQYVSPGDFREVVVDIMDLDYMEDCSSINSECAQVWLVDEFYRSKPALDSTELSRGRRTRFNRLIKLVKLSENEIKAVATVTWLAGGSAVPKKIVLTDTLYNWLPKDE